ncbi:MAG: 50S ribosome-binding GTPase [Bacteroidetes bacterium]|nr:50S ribosome-binding GTPase [Bacteroidota bacterium]
MELLRFFTAGEIDDGKSTLIGRLLYDSHSISTDIVEALTQQSKTEGASGEINLALITDGLRAERKQGITIDVAYKFFSTPKRKFIIADTPGHARYTRNMFTGASTAHVAIVLIDVQRGITEQTRRHSVILSILQTPHVLVCVNKMDLVDYAEEKFNQLKKAYTAFTQSLPLKNLHFLPVSALMGENIITPSEKMHWYQGLPLLPFLEQVDVKKEQSTVPRFQIQCLLSDAQGLKGFAGKILSGVYKKNQKVVVLPDGKETQITKIETHQQEVEEVSINMPAVFYVKDTSNMDRGSMIVPIEHQPIIKKEFTATICWFSEHSFTYEQQLVLRQGSFSTKARIDKVLAKIDWYKLTDIKSKGIIDMNEMCSVRISTSQSLSYDAYTDNKSTGAFILIDENTKNTIAAGVISK